MNLEFDSTWDNLTKKAIILNKKTEEAEEIAILDNFIYLNVLKNGAYSIGFVGYTIENDVKTYQISTNLSSLIIKMGAVPTIEHEIPTLTEWEIYIKQIQDICSNLKAEDLKFNDEEKFPSVLYYNVLKSHCPNVTSMTELEDWFKNIKAKVYYILETPTNETIELPNIPTHKGTNIIEVDTEIQPSNMEVKYYGK